MIRLFNVYYPIRTLILLAGEALIVWTSFLLGTMLQFREDSYLVLNFEYGYYKILMVTAVVLLFSHWFDLYDPSSFNAKWEQVFRLLLVLGLVALALAAVGFIFPRSLAGPRIFADRIDHSDLFSVRLAWCVRLAGAAAVPEGTGVCAGHGRKSAAAGEWLENALGVGRRSCGLER